MRSVSRVLALCSLVAIWQLVNTANGDDGVPATELPPLPKPVTSFGAAVADGWLYVYGGHLGTAHKYSAEMQSAQMVRLNLAAPKEWEVVGEVPRRTGLAMVSHAGKLYRIGGWEAKNQAGEKWELHSSRDFARFDPKTGQWQELAPLPKGRSSHDAAMLGSQLYVIGGWELAGKGDGEWHETAYVCDLAETSPAWKEIAKPPFNRRALAVAGWAGKVYVMGGMDDSNETTTETNVYDPQMQVWSKGPALPGKEFDGFGASAFGTTAGLFATTSVGGLFRLSADGQSWEQVGKLNHPRSFHRLVADGNERLLAVGGTSRGGKVAEVESLLVKRSGRQ